MGKARSITGFGTSKLSLSGSSVSTGAWLKFGPFLGSNLTGHANFTDAATSQACTLEASLTTESTGAFEDLIFFGDLTTAAAAVAFGPKNSTFTTSTNMYNYVRITTTSLASTGTMAVDVFFAANSGGQ